MGNTQQLLKILIAAAWLDGSIQPEERKYLHRMVNQYNLAQDPEIHVLLLESVPVKSEDCYRWIKEYLGDNPSEADYQNLIEAVSQIIYSDGNVETQEAEFLNKIQDLATHNDSPHPVLDKVLKTIQNLYQKAVKQQV